jgi:hypothetical protein
MNECEGNSDEETFIGSLFELAENIDEPIHVKRSTCPRCRFIEILRLL